VLGRRGVAGVLAAEHVDQDQQRDDDRHQDGGRDQRDPAERVRGVGRAQRLRG
jgi:hypothetical protein